MADHIAIAELLADAIGRAVAVRIRDRDHLASKRRGDRQIADFFLCRIHRVLRARDACDRIRYAALRIGHTPLRTVPALAGVYAAAHIGLYLLLTRFTDSTVPFWDAGTTALSVVAMWMLSRKLVEQWLVWLVVDLVTVGLYLYKDLPYTAGLYALYSALAVAGYLRWRRQARA